nr:MAG TPA: hypothetical protein [Caudoviricetes sp.]
MLYNSCAPLVSTSSPAELTAASYAAAAPLSISLRAVSIYSKFLTKPFSSNSIAIPALVKKPRSIFR